RRADVATPAPRMSPPRFGKPTRPCPRCGAVAPIGRYEVSTLRMLGWRPDGEASWVNWCGHTQRVRLEPAGEGWYREVPILEEAPGGATRLRSRRPRALAGAAWCGEPAHTAVLVDGVMYHGHCARRRGALMGEVVQWELTPADGGPRAAVWIVAI